MKTYLKLYHKSRGSGKSCVTTVVGGSLCASKMWENGVDFLNFRRYRWFKWPKANCLNVNISKRLNISSVRTKWDHFVQQLMSSDQYSHTHHNTSNHVHTSWDIMCGPFWLTLTIHQQSSPPENILRKSNKKINKLRNYIFPAPRCCQSGHVSQTTGCGSTNCWTYCYRVESCWEWFQHTRCKQLF